MSFSKVVIVLSSAKLYNEDFFIKAIRSFINTLNSNGPRIDPWGISESSVWNVLFMLFTIQNRTHLILQLVNREVCSQNALDESMRTAPAKNPLSSLSFHSSISYKIMWFEIYLLREAEAKSESMLLTWFSNLSFI